MESDMDEDQFENQSSLSDDLLDYEDYQEDKVNEEVLNRLHKVQDDAQLIQRQKQQKQKKRQTLTKEQLQARELKLLNARKYFEVVKLMFLQHVCASLKQTKKINDNYQTIIAPWLSLLNSNLLTEFMKLKSTKPLSLQIDEVLLFMRKAKKYLKTKEQTPPMSELFWSICEILGIGCRKIHFFDINSIVEEVFYQLKYHTSDLQRKKENKKSRMTQGLKIAIEQEMQNSMKSSENAGQFMFLDDFEFNEASFKSQKNNVVRQSMQDKQSRRENNFVRRKTYKQDYFQVFDVVENKWQLINSQILEIEDHEQSKKLVLEGKFIIGFYSTRLLHFKPQYECYCSLRPIKNIAIEDLTMYFEDNNRLLMARRKRLGVKPIMKHVFEDGSFQKNVFMLQNYDSYLYSKNDQIQLEYQLTVFPKKKEDMFTSPYFVVPSLLPKYCILNPSAEPVPDVEFNQQKVYLRRDIIPVTSKLIWIDRGRKVKKDAIPVKKTQNKNKNMTECFLYEQTQPFELSIDPQTGDFITDDQFNSMYIPSNFKLPPGLIIINKKISVVCNRAKIRHIKVVQGFTRSVGRIVPNEIGFLVYAEDEPLIQKLHEQRQKKLEQNKSKNRIKDLMSLWNKLFKKIELNQWSRNFQKTM